MLPYRDSRITRIVLVAFFAVIVLYAYYEGRGLLSGPVVEVNNRVMEVSEQFIMIEGTAERIATLSMNGSPIPVTEDGAFSEAYLLSPGYNRIALTARDRYGKTSERIIEIVYSPKENVYAPPPPSATSSEPVAR